MLTEIALSFPFFPITDTLDFSILKSCFSLPNYTFLENHLFSPVQQKAEQSIFSDSYSVFGNSTLFCHLLSLCWLKLIHFTAFYKSALNPVFPLSSSLTPILCLLCRDSFCCPFPNILSCMLDIFLMFQHKNVKAMNFPLSTALLVPHREKSIFRYKIMLFYALHLLFKSRIAEEIKNRLQMSLVFWFCFLASLSAMHLYHLSIMEYMGISVCYNKKNGSWTLENIVTIFGMKP